MARHCVATCALGLSESVIVVLCIASIAHARAGTGGDMYGKTRTRLGFAFRHEFDVVMTACTQASCESTTLCERSRWLGERASATALTFGDGASDCRWQHSHALRWHSTPWAEDVRAARRHY